MTALHTPGTKVGYFRKPFPGTTIYTGTVASVTEEAYEITPDHKENGLHTVAFSDLVSGSVHLWKAVELS